MIGSVGVVLVAASLQATHVQLDAAMRPATMDECERKTGRRPDAVVSHQKGINDQWFKRTCIFYTKGKP